MSDMVTMNAKDAIAGTAGQCFVTIGSNRYNFAQVVKVEAKIKKNKKQVPILGRTGKGNKASSWEGTGSATLHYNTSVFRELLKRYADTGEDLYFDMQIINNDPTSAAGTQIVTLFSCNLDGGTIAKLDADSDYLDEDVDFTFESWDMPQSFNVLDSMR